jgi:DNA-binding CsgD family transcriptional regulator
LRGKSPSFERLAAITHLRSARDTFGGDLFAAQRQLRTALLDTRRIQLSSARDLAAHMLLYLDDVAECWLIGTSWLRNELGCHRVDTGFGHQDAVTYQPGFAEAKAPDFNVPSFAGRPVDNRDAMMQAMWSEGRPLVYADIKQDRRVSSRMRQRMSGAQTRSKLAWALRTSSGSYGLICADWTEHEVPHQSDIYDCFEQTVSDVFSPIIIVAKRMSERLAVDGYPQQAAGGGPHSRLSRLTAAERDVAALVARGMSYKQIARMRGRSFSTIDHQLRSIREKTGTPSTAALIHLLSKSADE